MIDQSVTALDPGLLTRVGLCDEIAVSIISISAKYDKCCSIAIVLCRVPLAHQGTLIHEKHYVFPPLRLATESVPNNTLTNNHQSADIHATRGAKP